MTFEEGLRAELIQIAELNQKVFPLVAPKEVKAPFLVYKKVSVDFRKTLGGTSNKAEGVYDLVLLTEDYAQLQKLSEDIKDKLLSFQGRYIGSGGPGIENITVRFTGDEYEYEPNLLRSNIQIKVNY